MTQPFRVEWSEQALADWRRLSMDDAKLVARAAGSFPMEGIVIATSPSEYLPLVGRSGHVKGGRDSRGRYPLDMPPRDARFQAAALRLAAERLDRGESLAPSLADDMSRHPEELAAVEAHEGEQRRVS